MIRLEHISYTYTPGGPYETHALQDVNLEIQAGEFLGLIGHTGSGKSTLVQIMAGIVKPTGGRFLVDGEDLTVQKGVAKKLLGKIGLVFQYPEHQLFEETVYKDIAFGPNNMHLAQDEVDRRVKRAAEFVHLPESLFTKSPFELSGGQKRRVAIAGVLAMEPEMLILDEPTAGLDPCGREEILDEIRQLHKTLGTTVVLVSHSMEDIAKTVDRVVVMHRGQKAMDGPLAEVFGRENELCAMGLSVPQITSITAELRRQGLNLPDHIFTVKDAAAAIAKALNLC